MLTEKRYEVILNLLNEKNSVTVTEIKELLGISEVYDTKGSGSS